MAAARRLPSARALVVSPHRGLVEAATLALLYGVYELARGGGAASLSLARAHSDDVVALERYLHVFGERAVQSAVRSIPSLPAVLGISYVALHFLGTTAFLVWLHRAHRERFARVRNTIVVGTAISLAIFVLFPAAPPRLAGLGFEDTVTNGAHLNLSSHVIGSVYNPFAAVPSLHFAYALVVGITVAAVAERRWLRIAGALYPFVMLLVVVATGNHFFFDAAAAAAVVGLGYLAALAVDKLSSRRALRVVTTTQERQPQSQPAFHRAA